MVNRTEAGPRRRERVEVPCRTPPAAARRRLRPAAAALAGLALAGLGLAGCAQATRRVGDELVGKTLDSVHANRDKIETLLTSEEMREVTRALTREVVEAALEDLTGEERQARLRELSAEFVGELVPVIGEALSTEVWPELERALVEGVEKALDRALSPELRAKARELAAEIARGAVNATAPRISAAIADGVTAGVERSVAQVLEEQLRPALETLLKGDPPYVRRVAREVAHGALLGIADAMDEEDDPFNRMWDAEREEIILRLRQEWEIREEALSRKLTGWLVAAAGLALLLVVLAAFLFVRLRRMKRELAA